MADWATVPNFLTLVRLLLAAPVILTVRAGNHGLALALFLAAAVTDGLDGAIARHYGAITKLGAYLDPIADKCLLSGVYLALAASGFMPWWLVFVVFGRDLYLLLTAGLILWLVPNRDLTPSVWGKLSTAVQIATAVTWMTRNAFALPVLDSLSAAMLWPCAACTIWSALHYTWRGLRMVRAH